MGKIIEIAINDFSGGMTDEKYLGDFRYARFIGGFDAQTYKNKLIPQRDTESGDNAPTTSLKTNFAIAFDGSSFLLYALGVQSGANNAEVLTKTLGSGAGGLGGNTWAAPSANQGGGGTTTRAYPFVYYRNQAEIYGIQGQYIWAFSPTGTALINQEADLTTSPTNTAQGLVHSKDDICYIPYDNKIASKNGAAAFTVAALTLPTHFYITSICEYGNYLAIAAAPLSGLGNSKVYLWDRDSSLATLSEVIDWGEGELRILEEIDGMLVGISLVGGFSWALKTKHVFRYYAGGTAQVFKEFISENAGVLVSSSSDLLIAKQKVNKELYFIMPTKLNDTRREGIWKVARNKNGEFTVVLDLFANNGTALTSGQFFNFIKVGDYTFIIYNDNAVRVIDKTDDAAASFDTTTCVYESLIFNAGDSSKTKQLVSITIKTEPLVSGGQVTMGYKKNEDTSYTTIFTQSYDSVDLPRNVSHSAVNIESSGAHLPEFKEISFRIGSLGNAVITGFGFQYELLDKDTFLT